MDPFSAIASVVLGVRNANSLQRWARLLFSMTASYILGASSATGMALIGHSSTPVAIGTGLLSGSAMAFIAYLNSDKKSIEGTVLVVPQSTVEGQLDDKGRGPEISRGT